jgi:hypothetical protein
MSVLVKPTPEVIKPTLELFKTQPKDHSSTLGPRTLLRQALLLSVGTLTHRLINVMRSHGKPVPEIITFIDSISSEMKRMLEETSSNMEKILILKSMGNMGASETINPIKTLLLDPSVSVGVRINAVFALRRLAKQYRQQVIPILVSVYMDVKEERELRQGAFVVIINSNPSYTTLQMIAHSLRHEPHAQIRTLVYSSLVDLALYTSHQPEHKTLAQNARLILKYIPPVHVGLHDSKSLLISKFSDDFDLGGALNMIKIKSKMSGLPEALITNLQGTLFGKHRRLLEVGVKGKSLEVILKKIFGPHGLLKEVLKGQMTLQDLVRPLGRPEMGIFQEKIKDILNKMMVELKSDADPCSTWYVHLLGSELQYIILNSDNIEDVINKVTSFIPELFIKLTRGVKVDILKSLHHIESLTISSPIGIPLSLNHTMAGILKVEGHVKINNLPSWTEIMNKFTLPVSKISLDVDLKPLIEVTHYFGLGADLRWLVFGAGAKATLRATKPIKLSAHINPPEHAVSVKYFLPKQTVEMLHATFTPKTYVKRVPTTVHKLPYEYELKEIKNEEIVKVTPFEHKYRCSVTGMELESRGIISLCGPTWCPTFLGKQEITLIGRPVSTVDFVHLKIKSLRTNFDFEGVPASRPTNDLYQESEEDEEDQETYRQTDTYRASRRSMIEPEEFEPIPVDPIFQGEPIKRQLLITLGPSNKQSPKIKALVTWLMGRYYWKNQLNVQLARLAHGETPSWKLHLNNVINPLVWYPEETYKGETEFLNKMHLIWNIGGQTKDLKVKIIPGSPFDFTRELEEHSILKPTDSLPEAEAQKYKYTVVVDLPPMTNKMLKYMTVVQDFIKYQFYSQLTTSIPHQPLTDKVIVSVELLPWWDQMNVIVKTPRENSYISSVPFYWNPFFPTSEKIRLHDLPAWKWYSKVDKEGTLLPSFEDLPSTFEELPYTTSLLGGQCTFNPKTITTFDGARLPAHPLYNILDKGCPVLIAQDCSSQGLFTMTTTFTDEPTREFLWNLMVPGYEFVTKGKAGSKGAFNTLSINGEERPYEISKPFVIYDETSGTSKPVYKFDIVEPTKIIVTLFKIGMTVRADITTLEYKYELSPTSILQGQLCGVCGDFNQDKSDDFLPPYNTKSSRSNYCFLVRNIIPNERCNASRFPSIQNDLCTIKNSPLTIRRSDDQVPMTCTSDTRVPVCSEGCRPEQTKSTKVCFTCRPEEEGLTLPRKTYLAPRWDTYENGVECEDYFQRVEVPTRCIPTY